MTACVLGAAEPVPQSEGSQGTPVAEEPRRGGLRRHLLIAAVEVSQDAGCGLLDALA